MKKLILGLGIGIGVCFLMSVVTIDDSHSSKKAEAKCTYTIPIKQQSFFYTQDYKKVRKCIKHGWVVQDIDFVATNVSSYDSKVLVYYTLIKY